MAESAGQQSLHVAIIMDGNGRWAQSRGKTRVLGHRIGARTTHDIVESAPGLGVKTLTLFAFSSENWQRPEAEVRVLMRLFLRSLRQEVANLHANNVRLRFIGRRDRLSGKLQCHMRHAEQLTEANAGLELVVAVDYGGHWDLLQTTRTLARQCADGAMDAASIDEKNIEQALSLAGNAPDLFIRTGGERRISNFLLWDMAYTELYFCDQLWPDFAVNDFRTAIQWYGSRERRYGRVGSGA